MESTDKKFEITIDDATEGMQLAETVVDRNGKVVMPSDLILTEALITSLKQLGITHLFIVLSQENSQKEKLLEKKLARLNQLFRHSGDNSANRSLRESLRQHHIRRLS